MNGAGKSDEPIVPMKRTNEDEKSEEVGGGKGLDQGEVGQNLERPDTEPEKRERRTDSTTASGLTRPAVGAGVRRAEAAPSALSPGSDTT